MVDALGGALLGELVVFAQEGWQLPPEVLQMLRKWAESGWVPMRRLTTPADIGNVVALLCSEEAGFVTGQILHVDGGCSLAATDLPLELQGAA